MTYCTSWLALVFISLAVSLVAFLWGAKNGQFTDQARVRYLPLCDGAPASPPAEPARRPLEVLVLAGIAVCSLLVFLAPVLLTLWERAGR